MFLFYRIPKLTNVVSRQIFYALIIAFLFLGIASTIKSRRNYHSLAVNVLFPFELYHAICSIEKYPVLVGVSASAGALISVIYAIYVLSAPINKGKRFILVLTARLRLCLAKTMTILCLFLVPLMVFSIVGPHLRVADELESYKDCTLVEIYESNKELFSNLHKDKWDTLSVEEKKNLLQHIAYAEGKKLGLPYALLVEQADLEPNVLACYLYKSHTIQISNDTLEYFPVVTNVESICHECFHAYEYCLSEIYEDAGNEYKGMMLFKEAREYNEEFRSENASPEDIAEYISQKNEKDARNYAQGAAMFYFVDLGFA